MAAENGSDMNTEQILYDLLVQAEWQLNDEPLTAEQEFWKEKGPFHWKILKLGQISFRYIFQTVRDSIRLKASFGCPPTSFVSILSGQLPWSLSLSRNGKLLAVLKENGIEIRSWKDSFTSAIAKAEVGSDPFPQWRKLTWNKSSSLLAVASSFGEISVFDASCSLLYKLKQHGAAMNLPTGFSNCISALLFLDAPKSSEWESVLISVTYQGTLQRYLLSNTTYKEEHNFTFSRFHQSGVATAIYSSKHNVFVIAGFDGDEPTADQNDFTGAQAGITLWRELSDFPYYKMIDSDDTHTKKYGIYRCCLSPNEENLVSLHQDGRIAVWRMPSLRLEKTWSLSEQPSFDSERRAYFFNEKAKLEQDSSFQKQFVSINWWSDKAVICARGTGAISVSSTTNLENLLGQSEEMFEPWPHTTDASDGQFLVLECEKKLRMNGDGNILRKNEAEDDSHDQDDEEEETFINRASKLCKQTLFFLTEMENLRPPSKKLRFLQRIYRLIALQSTTPEELYSRKIMSEEYGEALDLARRFNLDTDLVYQRQWTSQEFITVISIKDYLSKITNRFWVLNECMQRVPEDIDAMKHLLKYGLLGTDRSVLERIQSDEKLPFVLRKESTDEEVDDDEGSSQNGDEKREKTKLVAIDVKSLTSTQIQLCKYRWQILQYLDRLETYEVILGGPFRAAERYKPGFFLRFRCCNILDQAVEYARDSCSEPLEDLFTYHGDELLPHWLAILSNFPETTPVSSYKRLLPILMKADSGEKVLEEWKQVRHRDPDWVEEETLKDHVIMREEMDDDPAEFIYQEMPHLAEFRSCTDSGSLTKWFKLRAHEVERRTSLVENALSLIDHGINNGVEGLADIRDDLKWLGTLVYEVGADPSITLSDFESFSNLAKLRLLMSKSTEGSFLHDFVKWGKRFIEFVGKSKPEEKWKLQKKYLVDVAKSDLTYPLKIMEKSIPETDEPIIADVANLMRLAIDCIYICKRDDQLDLAFKIVGCLPTREQGHLSTQIEDLHDKVDRLEQLLRGAEILELYSIPRPVSFLVDTKEDYKTAKDIIMTLCRNSAKKQPALNPTEWNLFLKHVQQLCEEVYTCISIDELYQIFAGFLLSSGIEDNLHLSKELLTCRRKSKKNLKTPESNVRKAMPRLTNATHCIPYDDSVNLVLEAAKEYFNAGAHFTDPVLDLARKCLGLIEDDSPILQYELDLLGALTILNDFDVNILPVQVRLYENKLDLISLAVNSLSAGYKKTAKATRSRLKTYVHKLARLLQLSGSDEMERMGKVTNLLAETALEKEDFSFARDMCLSLVDSNYAPGWMVCRTMCENDKFTDLDAKQKLIAFALTFCNPSEMENLLTTRNLIKTQVIYLELSKQEEADALDESVDGGDQPLDSADGQTPSSLLGRTQKQLTTKTKAIISNVSDTKWWRSQVKWVSHLHESESTRPSDSGKRKQEYGLVRHPFYAFEDVLREPVKRKDFDHLLDNTANNSLLEFNHLLLRSQKLCEARAEGTITEPSTEVILQLAESVLRHETIMFLGYCLSLPKISDAENLFSKYHDHPFILQLAAYVMSLELEIQKGQNPKDGILDLYQQDVMIAVKQALKDTNEESSHGFDKILAESLKKYIRLLCDFMQAKMLEELGKGVDVSRFMQDDEYKRETILGIAMHLEEDLLSTALSLAEKYNLQQWEVICAHAEFLLTDSGLKVKEIQERFKKLDAVHVLRENGAEFLQRMKLYVYPYISGKDHALLLLLLSFIQQCCGDEATIEGPLDVATHIRSLKKIKAAASGLDYKELVHGANPLDAVKKVLVEANVHVLSKLVPKINSGLGGQITSGEIFAAYTTKIFWEDEQKKEESKVQWLHRFEACQKYFVKLSANDILTLADDITFSDRARNEVNHETRLNMTKRLLKYVRQQKAQEEKQNCNSESMTYAQAESCLEKSLSHIQSLEAAWFSEWLQSDDEKKREYAHRFDSSRSDLCKVSELARDLFLDMRTPEEVLEIFKTADVKGKHAHYVADAFKDALTSVIESLKVSHDSASMDNLADMIDIVNEHSRHDGTLLSEQDVLQVVRPLCEDIEVDRALKLEILQLLEKSFELSGDDLVLLIYYKTDAIVSSNWDRKVSVRDIESDENRYHLFLDLMKHSGTSKHFGDIGQLLLVWPVLAATELNKNNADDHPWVILLRKLIECKNTRKFLELVKQSSEKITFGFECYSSLQDTLLAYGFRLEALKMALIVNNNECIEKAFHIFAKAAAGEFVVDNELFGLVRQSKTIKKVAKTALFPSFVDYILRQPNNEIIFNDILNQLKTAGLIAEAGTLISRQTGLHSALSNINVAISSFRSWFQR